MKLSKPLLLLTLLLLFYSNVSQGQKAPAKYTEYDYGLYYYAYEKLDSAFLMFNRYVNNADDTLKKGKAYNFMGDMQWKIGDLYGAQESLTGTIQTLNAQNDLHREDIGYAYNILGNVSVDLELYEEAIQFYNDALPFFKGADYELEVMNGKVTAYQKTRRYSQAITLYDSILARRPTDESLVARIIHNRARTKWLQNPAYPALPELRAALQIRADSQYSQGLNASYAHLSDYYAGSKPDSALWYAHKMREQARANHSPEDVLEAMDKLIRLSNSPDQKEYWYDAFKKVNDSLQLSRDTTRNRFALIRYDVQKNKTDNLLLQQHISRQQLLMYALMALALVIIVAISMWYNKRRQRIKQDAADAIRNDRLKTSQKVHDVVANGLYTIMNELEHGKAVEREPLMNKIEGLYEKSRNLSYEEILPKNNEGYDREIHELLTAFSNEQTRVIMVGNQPAFWSNITGAQRQELQLVLHELMVNMKKHSKATNVVLQFKQEHNEVLIQYKDDGVGWGAEKNFGNGLNNTVSRIKSLQGAINFDSNESAGIVVSIRFPLVS